MQQPLLYYTIILYNLFIKILGKVIKINSKVKKLARSGLLLAMALVFQIGGKVLAIPQVSQFVVGPAINAILLISVYACGIEWAIALGVLTPLTAILLRQLNPIMLPFTPFIIVGNIIFVLIFWLLKRYKTSGAIAGYIGGSFLKYIFLNFSSKTLVPLFGIGFPKKIYIALVAMMGLPQLITALIGGAVALIIIAIIGNKFELEATNGKY